MSGDARTGTPVAPKQAISEAVFPGPLELFAAVLLGRTQDPSHPRVGFLAAQARWDARVAIAAGRAPAGSEIPTSFRSLYSAARQEAAAAKPGGPPERSAARWQRALSALATLRHRQRAAVAMYYLAGLPVEDVAHVLGLREPQARAVIDAGVAWMIKAVGEPLDVRRALRTAGGRLTTPPVVRSARLVPPARMPRAVVRTLLAPIEPALAAPSAAVEPSAGEARSLAEPCTCTPGDVHVHALEDVHVLEELRALEDGTAPVEDRSPAVVSARKEPAPVRPVPGSVLSPVAQDMPSAPFQDVVRDALVALEAEPPDLGPERPVPPPKPARSARPAPVRTARARPEIVRQLAAVAALWILVFALVPADAGDPVAPPERVASQPAVIGAPVVRADARAAVVAGARLVSVHPGDSLWRIAEERLGDPMRWPEIWARNRGRTMTTGERFTDPALIRPRWKLRLPGR